MPNIIKTDTGIKWDIALGTT